jgi:hypothetical protein
MPEFMNGVVAHDEADLGLLKDAGIGWVREGVPYPFEDHIGGRLTPGYVRARAAIKRYADGGIKVMASALQPGSALRELDASGNLVLTWHNRYPHWYGELGTEEFLRHLEATAEWLGNDLQGLDGY